MKKYLKIAAVVLCFLVCGVLYSCGKTKTINLDHVVEDVSSTEPEETSLAESGDTKLPEPENNQQKESEAETEKQKAVVYVCGAVNEPDIYEMKAEERVADAIHKAGGFAEDADRNYLNLAEPVCDGMKIYVPTEQEVQDGYSEVLKTGEAAGSSAADTQDISSSGKININLANEEQLKTLNGIGASRAKDIVEYREAHGDFQKIEDIMKVPGIKNGMFEKIKDDIEV